ncbi:MAG: glycosyltransferase family 39 protein [Planctomycetes bacterium]|nr:glycosyltransferase family 39 protein [Planctomycetota bacterium]
MPQRSWLWIPVVAYLALALHVSHRNSAAFDEIHHHLPSGYTALERGTFWMKNGTNPPFFDAAYCLPLWGMDLHPAWDHPSLAAQDRPGFGVELAFHSGGDLTRILSRARLLPILVGAAGVWAAGALGTLLCGARGGLLAAWVTALNPLYLANAHLVKSDVAAGTFAALTALAVLRDLRAPSTSGLWFAGIFLGAAQLAKFSCLALYGILPVWFWLGTQSRWAHERRSRAWCARRMGALLGISLLTVWGGYGFQVQPLLQNDADPAPELDILEQAAERAGLSPIAPLLRRAALEAPVPMADYLDSLPGTLVFAMRQGYAIQFFLGEISRDGWWSYYPVALLLKNPVGLWILLALGLCARPGASGRRFEEIALTCWCIAFLAIACASRNNTGVRYLFPILPCLWTLAGRAAADPITEAPGTATPIRLRKIACGLAFALFAVESLSIHPYPVGHFSWAVGGGRQGYRYLRDSNVDMGQGLAALADFERTFDEPGWELAVDYGGGNATGELLQYYGIRSRRISDGERAMERIEPRPGVLYAVSAMAMHRPDRPYAFQWMRGERAERQVGGSLFLFRSPAGPRRVPQDAK